MKTRVEPVLNRLDRAEVYRNAMIYLVDSIVTKQPISLCNALIQANKYLGNLSLHKLKGYAIIQYYPELMKYKPNNSKSLWFPIHQSTVRKTLLIRAYNQTKL